MRIFIVGAAGKIGRRLSTELAAKMLGSDAVVFTAGSHGAGKLQEDQVDGGGLILAAEAAKLANISTLVLVSIFPEAARGDGLGEGFEYHALTKKQSEVHLTQTNLDWLIVRAGRLTEDPGTGLVDAGPA